MAMRRVLVIDASEDDLRAIGAAAEARAELRLARTAGDGIAAFLSERPDAVVVGAVLPDMQGLDVLGEIRSRDPNAPVIVIAEPGRMELTVEAIKRGASDCLSRPVDPTDLSLSLDRVFKGLELERRARVMLPVPGGGYRPDAIVGRSRCMEEVFKAIAIASQSKVTVLIQGESGTGKELIARAIHFNSAERERPFVAINCSALVETLLESELFGHEKGAFTGALFRKEGKFEAASGGTVFLDEVGEMSHALQAKLLRVLQDKSFERVGGSETIRTEVRVIAATNRSLQELVSSGGFREDLYYRLKVITLDVPPLRERRTDIPLLVGHLLDKANRELHKRVVKVPDNVMRVLMEYPWPGNVRELENVLTRGVLLAKGDVLVDVYLPAEDSHPAPDASSVSEPAPLSEVEKEHILKALNFAGWNKTRAAMILGVTLPRLARKIKKYGLEPFPGARTTAGARRG